MGVMWKWLRENYGWEAKRAVWMALGLGLLFALTLIAVMVPD